MPQFVSVAGHDLLFIEWEHETIWGRIIRMEIRRKDDAPIHSWREIYELKEAIHPGRYAIEIYPPRDRLIDNVHHYHLWVMPEGFVMPFGIHEDDEGRWKH